MLGKFTQTATPFIVNVCPWKHRKYYASARYFRIVEKYWCARSIMLPSPSRHNRSSCKRTNFNFRTWNSIQYGILLRTEIRAILIPKRRGRRFFVRRVWKNIPSSSTSLKIKRIENFDIVINIIRISIF